MSEPTRYLWPHRLEQDPQGTLVSIADYLALRAQLAQMTQERDDLKKMDALQLEEIARLEATLARVEGERNELKKQQESLWLRFTVCTSHDEFCEDLDELILTHEQTKECLAQAEQRETRLRAALEAIAQAPLEECWILARQALTEQPPITLPSSQP